MSPSPLARVVPLRPDAAPRPDDVGSDAELVARAREGMVWARSQLFRRHAPPLTAMLTRLLGSTSDAEDAVQDSFVEALGQLAALRDPAAFGGWLRRIGVHQAHRRFRRRRLLHALGFDPHVEDATLAELSDPAARPDLRAEIALIGRVLARVSTADRMAWMLRHVEGHELTEVAELCGCSLATAKRRIAAAQERIARHVDRPEYNDSPEGGRADAD